MLIHAIQIALIFAVIFIERKKPGEALMWAALLLLSPLVGSILYLLFGYTVSMKIAYKFRSRKISDEFLKTIKDHLDDALKKGEPPLPGGDETENQNARFNLIFSESPLTAHNEVSLFTEGKSKYAKLLLDISEAKESIHMAYYGFHNDSIGKQFVDALAKKAREGVKVRLLYDGIGSLLTPKSLFRPLIESGGYARRINPYLSHFRYHRKIVVIDGRIGYTGGMNIGEKYTGALKSKSPWRDTQIRIIGEAVHALQYHFICDWLYANNVHAHDPGAAELKTLFPETDVRNPLPCQVVVSGIGGEAQSIKLSYMRMISSAKNSMLLQSPYFIPDESLIETMQIALASGIEVKLMLPKRRSSFFLQPVTNHYIARLIPLGLKVYLYDGYIHAKALRVDDSITCIGSVNLDMRSLEIDQELCAILYGKEFAAQVDQMIKVDLSRCEELDYEAFMHRGLIARIQERFFLLFAPLM